MAALQFLGVVLLAAISYAAIDVSLIATSCYLDRLNVIRFYCAGPIFETFRLVLFTFEGLLLSLVSYGIHVIAKPRSWYRPRYLPLMFVAIGILLPRLLYGPWSVPVSSRDVLVNVFTSVASLGAGFIVLILWDLRSNSSVQPTPVDRAVDAGR